MKYVADDGTEFTTEQECLNYENRMAEIEHNFILFNEAMKRVSPDMESCEYIYVFAKPEEVVQYLSDRFGFCGLDDITKIGLYFYDWTDYTFKSVDSTINDFEAKVSRLKSLKNGILNTLDGIGVDAPFWDPYT